MSLALLPTLLVFSGGPALADDPVNLNVPLGSTGADGALVVDFNEDALITLPGDGILNYTTVTIRQGATVTFERNARNTPVFILATGDILIEAGATISVDGGDATEWLGGEAGPGGFDGADRPAADQAWGRGGFGPGGGGAQAPNHNPANANSNYLTEFLMPLVGGSGGASGAGTDTNNLFRSGGGGGGGAILLASDTRINHLGTISAEKGTSLRDWAGKGSGGAVRLLAPVVEGNGRVVGAARTRVDALDTGNLAISPVSAVGDLMLAFLPTPPSLRIIGVDDQSVPQNDDGSTVFIAFALDGPTTRPVHLRATNLTGRVDIRVRLTPEEGPVVTRDVILDMDAQATGDGGAEGSFDMDFPVNKRTFVEAWTLP